MERDIEHKDAKRLRGTPAVVDDKEYVIAGVFMDGSLLLEPKELYGTEDSVANIVPTVN